MIIKKCSFGCVCVVLVAVCALVSCSSPGAAEKPLVFGFDSNPPASSVPGDIQTRAFPAYPDMKVVHISDTHLYAPELGVTGAAFQDYLNHDRKLLAQSMEILQTAQPLIIQRQADFVVISGDLTKDGELVNHQHMAQWCAGLEDAGVQVYVVPGNHDINNPHAKRFAGDTTEQVQGIDPAAFAALYGRFGYEEALERDGASLSYVVQPKAGVWLLALDSADYNNNYKLNTPVIAGRLSDQTLVWVEDVLKRAQEKGVAVLATMHHGVVEHWPGQKKFNPEYVVRQDLDIQRLFAHYGVRLVFTGHYHSHDIAKAVFKDGTFVYDMENGSMMTWPLPWRELSFANRSVTVRTHEIESIPSIPTGFQKYAYDFTANGIATITKGIAAKFLCTPQEGELLASQSIQSFLTHYKGDEVMPTDRPIPDRRNMGIMANLILDKLDYVLVGQYRDSTCADRNLIVDLDKGTESPLAEGSGGL